MVSRCYYYSYAYYRCSPHHLRGRRFLSPHYRRMPPVPLAARARYAHYLLLPMRCCACTRSHDGDAAQRYCIGRCVRATWSFSFSLFGGCAHAEGRSRRRGELAHATVS